MNIGQQKLVLEQLDQKLGTLKPLKSAVFPSEGWIHVIRVALKMSLRQLGNRIGITAQGVKDIELREKEGTITLKNLREVANALDMQLVYGFLPKEASLEKMIEKKAYEIATKIVLKTSNTMKLEAQENSQARLKKAIEEKTAQIKAEMPRYLWD
jgi:predicted DNA-binding mobile mystery protein A